MLVNGGFHLGGVDVLAAGNDHVLGPIDDENVAVLIPSGHIAGPHPAIAQRLGGQVRLAPVAEHVGLGLNDDLTRRTAILRYVPSRRIDHPGTGDEAFPSAGVEPLRAVARHSGGMVLLGEKGHGHAFGLAVALNQGAREGVEGRLDHGFRHRPATVLDVAQARQVVAVEAVHRHHPVEHGGDAEERRHPLGLNDLERLGRVEVHQHHRAAVRHVVHGQGDRNVEHLAGEHVHVARHHALGDCLVEHAHV